MLNKKLLLFYAFLLLLVKTNSNLILHVQPTNYNKLKRTFINYRDSIIKAIPYHEGIRYIPYNCSAGHLTIGCGHVILKEDNLTYPLNYRQVLVLLESDVNKAEDSYERIVPIRVKRRLLPNQKWAIVHFIFCKGSGSFNNSTLKKLIINNKPIDDEIVKWSYYHIPNGKLINSKWSYKIRIYELNLYNKYEKK